jgi:hypothetical protein
MSLSRQASIESGRPVEALDVPQEVRLIDLWDAWLFAEADASLALRDWSCAADTDESAAYAAYRAALDREELAAVVLEAFLVGSSPVDRSSEPRRAL